MPTMDTMDIILDTLTTATTERGLLMLMLRLMLDTFMVTMDMDTTLDMPTMDTMDTHTDMPVMDITMESNPLMDIIINLKF